MPRLDQLSPDILSKKKIPKINMDKVQIIFYEVSPTDRFVWCVLCLIGITLCRAIK